MFGLVQIAMKTTNHYLVLLLKKKEKMLDQFFQFIYNILSLLSDIPPLLRIFSKIFFGLSK
jgi:hypothetical protein